MSLKIEGKQTVHLDVVAAGWCEHCKDAKGQLDEFLTDYKAPLTRRHFTHEWTYMEDDEENPLPLNDPTRHAELEQKFTQMGWDGAYPTFLITKFSTPTEVRDGKSTELDSETIARSAVYGFDRHELRQALDLPRFTIRLATRRITSAPKSVLKKLSHRG